MFSKLLKSIDIYGSSFEFTIFENKKFKTVIGGCFTILTLALFILCFYYFGKDFYQRTNPHYLNQKITLKDYPNYTINTDDFVFAFEIEDENSLPFDTTGYLDIQVTYQNATYETTINQFIYPKSPIDIINCTSINYTAMRMENHRDLSAMSCLKFNKTKMGGYYDANFVNLIEIKILPCINSTYNKNMCKDRNLTGQILN